MNDGGLISNMTMSDNIIPNSLLSDIVDRPTQHCSVTTPSYLRSWRGRVLTFYDRGVLALMPDSLVFLDGLGRRSWLVSYDIIQSVQVKTFSWLVQPFGLKYIQLIYEDAAGTEELWLTPHQSHGMPVWQTNPTVRRWRDLICSEGEKIGRIY